MRSAHARRIPGPKTSSLFGRHIWTPIIPLNGAVEAVTLEASSLKQHICPVSATAAKRTRILEKPPGRRAGLWTGSGPVREVICNGNAQW